MYRRKLALTLGVTALALPLLAACGSSDDKTSGGSAEKPPAGTDLGTADVKLGTIVVDGQGLTAYVFDMDQPNATTSACTGKCAEEWPPITSSSAKPKVDGVTGEVGTIKAADGGNQITLNGQPLYTYADDEEIGDTEGQGEHGIWWVVDASGKKITKDSDTGSDSDPGGY